MLRSENETFPASFIIFERKDLHVSLRTCNQQGELRVNFASECTYVPKTFCMKTIFMAHSLMFINIYELTLCIWKNMLFFKDVSCWKRAIWALPY